MIWFEFMKLRFKIFEIIIHFLFCCSNKICSHIKLLGNRILYHVISYVTGCEFTNGFSIDVGNLSVATCLMFALVIGISRWLSVFP